jgi:hypothetical protein
MIPSLEFCQTTTAAVDTNRNTPTIRPLTHDGRVLADSRAIPHESIWHGLYFPGSAGVPPASRVVWRAGPAEHQMPDLPLTLRARCGRDAPLQRTVLEFLEVSVSRHFLLEF